MLRQLSFLIFAKEARIWVNTKFPGYLLGKKEYNKTFLDET
tara:strand:- start:615 stop:737 length:123 start_codon:yes stop_codon:yes gene_type:complete